MVTSIVRATVIALVASAVSVFAERGLLVKVSGPETVDGVQKFKVITTLTNTGDEDLKLLNDPRGALNTLPANTFDITTDFGGKPSFIGVKVKYVLQHAAQNTDEKSFTVLAPGQSASVSHDLSAAYNFTLSGPGTYTVEPSNLFHYVDPETHEPVAIRADREAHVAAVSGQLAVVHPTSILTKRETYKGCSSSQKTKIQTAAPAAQTYVAKAHSYLQKHTATSPRYTTWFGSYTSSHHSTVLSHYTKMNGNNYSSFTYDCTCTDTSTYAYVYPDNFGHIYLCGAFWQAPTTGTDSKGGTLVHESSHFTHNGGTQDYAYGQINAKNLAKKDPAEAIMNADNHEYFAENHPSQS